MTSITNLLSTFSLLDPVFVSSKLSKLSSEKNYEFFIIDLLVGIFLSYNRFRLFSISPGSKTYYESALLLGYGSYSSSMISSKSINYDIFSTLLELVFEAILGVLRVEMKVSDRDLMTLLVRFSCS